MHRSYTSCSSRKACILMLWVVHVCTTPLLCNNYPLLILFVETISYGQLQLDTISHQAQRAYKIFKKLYVHLQW
uniref:Uncharacterized protein n=1 Tax=Anguilla anguilla TaxID=7936 RepID=A0A0E9TDQ5_ANGAN